MGGGQGCKPIFAWASVTAFRKEDLPAEGFPTQATSTSCIPEEDRDKEIQREKE